MPAAGYEAPHIDWNRGRQLWTEGANISEIADALGCARSTVDYRAKREKWRHATKAMINRAVAARTNGAPKQVSALMGPTIGSAGTQPGQATELSQSERVIAGIGKRSPQTLSAVIHGIAARGLAASLACDLAGITDDTLRAWRRDDPEVDQAIRAAIAERAALRIQAIDDGESTWQSRAWALARDPATREIYGDQQRGSGGPSLVVQINVRGPGDDADTVTIEGAR